MTPLENEIRVMISKSGMESILYYLIKILKDIENDDDYIFILRTSLEDTLKDYQLRNKDV